MEIPSQTQSPAPSIPPTETVHTVTTPAASTRSPLMLILGAVLLSLFSGMVGFYLGTMVPPVDNWPENTSPVVTPTSTPAPVEVVVCTMEAMICPDGSSVGRSGPNCEFDPCPTAPSASDSASLAEVGDVVEFEGELTAFNDSCKVDAACVAVVNGYSILVNQGEVEDRSPVGNSDVWTEDIGSMVKVKAEKTGPTSFTIIGDKNYYVLKVAE